VPGFVNYKKGALDSSDKVHQLLAHGRWFSPGTPASSTTKTGRHDIAEILLKVALGTINLKKSNHPSGIGNFSRVWLCCVDPLVYLFAKTIKLFGFPMA
jgi:hypothetical protein